MQILNEEEIDKHIMPTFKEKTAKRIAARGKVYENGFMLFYGGLSKTTLIAVYLLMQYLGIDGGWLVLFFAVAAIVMFFTLMTYFDILVILAQEIPDVIEKIRNKPK